MVFHSISKSETTPPQTKNTNQHQHRNQNQNQQHQMASSTMKSTPLHNFSLPDLKWAMNHTNTHRLRKPADPTLKSPQRDTESDSDTTRNKGNKNQSEAVKIGNNHSGSSSAAAADRKIEKSEKKVIASSSGGGGGDHAVENLEKKPATTSDGRSRIFIRFRTKSSKNVEEVAEAGDQALVVEDAEELVPKTWNLRPRKPVTKPSNANGGAAKSGGGAPGLETKPHPNSSRPELTRSRNAIDAKAAAEKKEKEKEKEKKPKFSLSLSKEEIEDDIFCMTGAKPNRRPKKRAKNVQKQIDSVFPGMWLASITPDSYRVHDTSSKAPPKN